MNKLIIMFLMLITLCSTNAIAFDKWDKEDVGLQLTYSALHIADWKQTRQIAQQPHIYYEKNHILGRHPSVGKVNTYMAITLGLHTLVTHVLPKEYRKYWQGVWIAREADAVSNNHKIGLKVQF